MLIRFLAILALVWQPLALSGTAGRNSSAADCLASSCCEIVEQESNCGGQITHHCGKPGEECLCGVSPTDQRERLPEGPLPKTDRETLSAIQGPTLMPIIGIDSDPDHTRIGAIHGGPLTGKTHNEVQALLGIWRT